MSSFPLLFAVISLNLFAYITIRIRPWVFNTQLFKPMIWNFKLSILPFLTISVASLVFILIAIISAQLAWPVLYYIGLIIYVIGILIWLVLLPNAAYLITELNLTHREVDTVEVPLWYDIISILTFALSGIINTLANIFIIQTSLLI